MLTANTPLGRIKFKNSWEDLNAKEILWYENTVPALMEEALEQKDDGFEKSTVVKDEEAYQQLNYALLTLCCRNKRKLLKAPWQIAAELIEKGAISFYQEKPEFADQLQKTLQGMTVGQFAMADMIHREYRATGREQELNLFAAALHTPFAKEQIEELAERKAKMTEAEKRYLMFRFKVYLNDIAEQSPLAFESDPLADPGEPMDWRESMLQMAKDGPFGDFKTIETKVRFVDYAAEMHRVKKEYKAQKKALKQKK